MFKLFGRKAGPVVECEESPTGEHKWVSPKTHSNPGAPTICVHCRRAQ